MIDHGHQTVEGLCGEHFRQSWPEADGTWTDDVIYALLRDEWRRC